MSEVKIRPQELSDAKRFLEIITHTNLEFIEFPIKTLEEEKHFLQLNEAKRKANSEYNYSILYYGKRFRCKKSGNFTKQVKNIIIRQINYFHHPEKWHITVLIMALKYAKKIFAMEPSELVGACGIKINQHRPWVGEIWYFIDRDYQKKGIATEALRQLERVGFEKLYLQKIIILMDTRNFASERVAQKCNYEKEGIMKKAHRLGEDYYDCFLYAKTR
jgi:Acetyltransferases, including N-acetylases of ribosomal proteins